MPTFCLKRVHCFELLHSRHARYCEWRSCFPGCLLSSTLALLWCKRPHGSPFSVFLRCQEWSVCPLYI